MAHKTPSHRRLQASKHNDISQNKLTMVAPAFASPLPPKISQLWRQSAESTKCAKRGTQFLHPKRKKVPFNVSMNSVSTPDSFSTKWYQSVPLLDLDQNAHHIAHQEGSHTDYNFVDSENGFMALIDYPINSNDNVFLQGSPASQMIQFIEQRLHHTTQYSQEPVTDLRAILASAIDAFGAPPQFSALITHISSGMLRAAWVGTCGFVLIRDDEIQYRSYGNELGTAALENLFEEEAEEQLPHLKMLTRFSTQSRSPTSVDVSTIQTDFFELQPDDLIIAGSDGLFSNVSEKQMVAFVRPVPDAEDSTLAIANNTCLGSWRYDDVQFISYYLAIIAVNFSTAIHSKPYLSFPFPPSPHLDDVTVLTAACPFGS